MKILRRVIAYIVGVVNHLIEFHLIILGVLYFHVKFSSNHIVSIIKLCNSFLIFKHNTYYHS